jgi:tetratricopeptide (TPR) repeat protein
MMPRSKAYLLGFLLIVATLAAYWPALNNDFVNLDDREYVTENPHVITGLTWSNVAWAFRTGYASNWHPLTWLSHQLDVQLFGLNPRWHHFTNLLFHIANSVLLLFLLRRMTGALWRSALVAALFALHPLHVESVTWVAERKDVLSTFFFILTLIAYAMYAEVQSSKFKVQSQKAPSIIRHPASAFYLLTLMLFALGLMSKPMLVTLPFVLLLLDYWPLGRLCSSTINYQLSTIGRLLLEKLPFFALSAISSVITFLVQSRGQAIPGGIGLEARLVNAFASYLNYLGNAFCPTNLAVFYPHPTVTAPDLDSWGWYQVAAVLVVIAVSGWAVLRLKREPWFAVGWFWYLGTLVPVIGIVQVGGQAMADRYTYIPLIGIFVLAAWGLTEVLSRVRPVPAYPDVATTAPERGLPQPRKLSGLQAEPCERFPLAPGAVRSLLRTEVRAPAAASGGARFAPLLCGAGGFVVLAACAFATRNQVGYWHSTFSLFEHAVAATKNNPMAHYGLGQIYAQQNKYTLAEDHYLVARQEAQKTPEPYIGLGTLYYQQGKIEEALGQFQTAVRVGSLNALAHNYLGVTYERLARDKEALEEFARAASLSPDFAAARSNLGAALAKAGRLDEAVANFQAALACDPRCAPAHFGLANSLNNLGKREEAIIEYQAALRLNPTNAAALNDLAWLRAAASDARLRNGPEAVKLAEQACQLTAFREPLRVGTLAAAYAEAGRFEDAVKTGEKAKALALAGGKSALAARNEELLTLYRARKAYHEAK